MESTLKPFPSADTLLALHGCCGQPAAPSQNRHEPRPNLKRCRGVRDGLAKQRGGRQGWGLRAQAVCSQEAGARLQGPLRRLLPLIGPPLAPKNNILVCLLGALRDRDRLFIPAISDAALLPPPGRPAARPPARGLALLRPPDTALSPLYAARLHSRGSSPSSALKQGFLSGGLQVGTEPFKSLLLMCIF